MCFNFVQCCFSLFYFILLFLPYSFVEQTQLFIVQRFCVISFNLNCILLLQLIFFPSIFFSVFFASMFLKVFFIGLLLSQIVFTSVFFFFFFMNDGG